jgi:hypothetical protein
MPDVRPCRGRGLIFWTQLPHEIYIDESLSDVAAGAKDSNRIADL